MTQSVWQTSQVSKKSTSTLYISTIEKVTTTSACINFTKLYHFNKINITYLGSVQVKRLEHPEVRLATGLKFECANRIIDVFQTVDDAVRVVVGGVHTPLVTGVRVRHVLDTIRDLM